MHAYSYFFLEEGGTWFTPSPSPLVFIFLRRCRNFEFFCLVLGLMEHPFNPQYNPVLWGKGDSTSMPWCIQSPPFYFIFSNSMLWNPALSEHFVSPAPSLSQIFLKSPNEMRECAVWKMRIFYTIHWWLQSL